MYIGQTSNSLEKRAGARGRNYIECRRFYTDIKKYTWKSFIPEILETVQTFEEANKRERYYIDFYHSTDSNYGYNLLPGGDCRDVNPETRKIISNKAKEHYIDKTCNPMYGKNIPKKRWKSNVQKNLVYITLCMELLGMKINAKIAVLEGNI